MKAAPASPESRTVDIKAMFGSVVFMGPYGPEEAFVVTPAVIPDIMFLRPRWVSEWRRHRHSSGYA